MTKEQQMIIFDKFISQMRETLLLKGDDYSNEDRLSNFKYTASLVGLSSEKVCLNMIAVKLARLSNLCDEKKPNNESIDDSILDLTDYCVLLKMIREENKQNDLYFGTPKKTYMDLIKHFDSFFK